MGHVTPRVIQGRLPILLAALVASGVASIINQVSWQRGLKVFLGGSEALSAMTVVFVFMLGLAVGAAACSARASSIRNPLRALALVEVALCLANVVVALLLSTDISETIYSMQRAAVAAGIPLRALYVVGSIGVLVIPCALMGVTMPLASEAYQRQLNGARASLVNVLLSVNTGGAVIGALVSGFYLLPRYGQTAALVVAAAMNGVAGLVLLAFSSTVPAVAAPLRGSSTAPETTSHVAGRAALTPTGEDMTGFFMGMFSLGYEDLPVPGDVARVPPSCRAHLCLRALRLPVRVVIGCLPRVHSTTAPRLEFAVRGGPRRSPQCHCSWMRFAGIRSCRSPSPPAS